MISSLSTALVAVVETLPFGLADSADDEPTQLLQQQQRQRQPEERMRREYHKEMR
jgi:hypothetical protein